MFGTNTCSFISFHRPRGLYMSRLLEIFLFTDIFILYEISSLLILCFNFCYTPKCCYCRKVSFVHSELVIYIFQNLLSFTKNVQGRSQNLKAVPQNLMEVFKVDDVTFNDVIQKKQYLLRKEKLQISHSNPYCLISIFSIKFISKGITS